MATATATNPNEKLWKELYEEAAKPRDAQGRVIVGDMDVAAKQRAGLIPHTQVMSLEDRLEEAAETGDVEAIRRLVAAGADVNHKDVLSKSPMHFAAVHGQTEALRVLKELGGDPDARAMGDKRPLDWARVANRGTKRADAAGSLALLESWAAAGG